MNVGARQPEHVLIGAVDGTRRRSVSRGGQVKLDMERPSHPSELPDEVRRLLREGDAWHKRGNCQHGENRN